MAAATRRGAFAIALLVAACAAPGPSVPASSPVAIATSTPVPAPTTEPTAAPTAPPEPTPLPSILGVSAFANIFGAGRTTPPAPGGGGAGSLPPEWPLPAGATRFVSFPQVTGQVYGRINQAPPNGPEGEPVPTDVMSFDGISGIVHANRAMFLVGVFLTDEAPTDPAPERLDFTDNEDFKLLKPEIGQTFLIGDGIGRRYQVPPGATRLFLGFAEAMFYVGDPGWYGNNSGALEVKVKTTVE